MEEINEDKKNIKLLERKIKQLEFKIEKLNEEKDNKIKEEQELKQPKLEEINKKLKDEKISLESVKNKEQSTIMAMGVGTIASVGFLIWGSVLLPVMFAFFGTFLVTVISGYFIGRKIEKMKTKIEKIINELTSQKLNLENEESEEISSIKKEIKDCEFSIKDLTKELTTLKDYIELQKTKQNLKEKTKNIKINNEELTK